MRLLIQPGEGVHPLVRAINSAKRNIEIVIFRCEQREIERALASAVGRGVAVHALIAHTNRAGEESLRKLEMRFLAAGITVARTADDLARYHSKMMIVDHRDLYVLAFNLTYSDIELSRSFGVVTRKPALVREAEQLFDADTTRHAYESTSDQLAVSPVNARRLLADFIRAAKKELFIYDPKISDRTMVRLLEERAAAGVDIRIIGKLTRRFDGVQVCKLSQMRLHTRTMVRDGKAAFVGSQSLRPLELDARREVGLIFRDVKAVAAIRKTFLDDWAAATQDGARALEPAPVDKVAKRVAKLVIKELPPVAPVLTGAVKELVGAETGFDLDPEEVEAVVKGAVKAAVKEAVSEVVEEVVVGEEAKRSA